MDEIKLSKTEIAIKKKLENGEVLTTSSVYRDLYTHDLRKFISNLKQKAGMRINSVMKTENGFRFAEYSLDRVA